MVHPMDRYPASRSILQAAHAKDGECVLEPFRHLQTLVREQPVVCQVDSQRSEDVVANEYQDHAGPAKQPGHKRQQAEQMQEAEDRGSSIVLARRRPTQFLAHR